MKIFIIVAAIVTVSVIGALFPSIVTAGGTSDDAPFANVDRPPLNDKWNFVVGYELYVEDFVAQHECVTAIWQYSNVGGYVFWRAYFPKDLTENGKDYFAIRYLFIDESYMIYCDGGE